MALFVLSDPHLSLGCDKPMDVFGGWQNYVERLESSWRRQIGAEDTVVLPGDISWAMDLEHCTEDFRFLHDLPGKKILGKGNHDYWWTTMNKMKNFLAQNGFDSLDFLFNNAFFYEDLAICGTRSWFFDGKQEHDEKMLNRELGRLRTSLQMAGDREKLVFLHYPPIFAENRAEEILQLLKEYQVKECYFGHLHGYAAAAAWQGESDGIRFRLVSADALKFSPLRIR